MDGRSLKSPEVVKLLRYVFYVLWRLTRRLGPTSATAAGRAGIMPRSVLTAIRDDDFLLTAASEARIIQAFKYSKPGQYVIVDSSVEGQPLSGGLSCQRWGVAVRFIDGTVVMTPEPPLAAGAR